MTFEEAKKIFINRGFVEIDDGSIIFNGDQWRQACFVISKFLEDLPAQIPVSESESLQEKNVEVLATTYSILDNIKNEFIDRYPRNYANELELGGRSCVFSLNEVIEIIDKYEKKRL